jgi:hypothetical protein
MAMISGDSHPRKKRESLSDRSENRRSTTPDWQSTISGAARSTSNSGSCHFSKSVSSAENQSERKARR